MFVNINLLLLEQGGGGGPGEEKVGAEVQEDNLNLHIEVGDHMTCSLLRGFRATSLGFYKISLFTGGCKGFVDWGLKKLQIMNKM